VGRQVVKPCPSELVVMRRRISMGCSQILFFLGWWPHLFSQERWGNIRYGVYGFPAIYYRGNLVVSRFLGRNW
jgi:hypothetical protein